MPRKMLDLALVAGLAVGAAATSVLDLGGPIRPLLALPLVLVLPGYSLTAALFPTRDLGGAERVCFTLGLSLAVVALGGFALNWAPGGLEHRSWLLLLVGATLIAGAVALLRRADYPAPADDRASAFPGLPRAALLALAALVVISAFALSRAGAIEQRTPSFTQLWMLPAPEPGDGAVHLGIANLESTAQRYRLRLQLGGQTIEDWPAIDLEPGERWEATAGLPALEPGAGPVEALLSRPVDAEPYRRVTYWPDRGKER